jgi:hypothetical protein
MGAEELHFGSTFVDALFEFHIVGRAKDVLCERSGDRLVAAGWWE